MKHDKHQRSHSETFRCMLEGPQLGPNFYFTITAEIITLSLAIFIVNMQTDT